MEMVIQQATRMTQTCDIVMHISSRWTAASSALTHAVIHQQPCSHKARQTAEAVTASQCTVNHTCKPL
jgi:hypothetical protein